MDVRTDRRKIVKKKLKNDQTNINKYRLAANITEYHKNQN